MKGVLFNVAEDVVDQTLGSVAWDAALCSASVPGVYTSLGNYPDSELMAIVDAVAEQTHLSVADVLRHLGRHGYPGLASRRPELLAGFEDLGSLLHGLDSVIHPEVHKLDPSARPPRFEVSDVGPGRWQVTYRSERQLCHLAEGLMTGAADSFGVVVEIDQPECTLLGAPGCTLHVRQVVSP